MTAIRFNPLTYANKLKEAGFNDKQAETFAQLQEEILTNVDTSLLATKHDLLILKIELKDTINSNMYKMVGLFATIQALFIGILHFLK